MYPQMQRPVRLLLPSGQTWRALLVAVSALPACAPAPARRPEPAASTEIDLTRPAAERPAFPAGLVPCPKDAEEGSGCSKSAESPAPARPSPADERVWRVPVGPDDPVRGASDALLTVVVFSDFECPYCRRTSADLDALAKEYGRELRLVWKDCPSAAHTWAVPAAEFARAVRAVQGDAGFWKVHDRLYAEQARLGMPLFRTIAAALGLAWPPIGAAIEGARHGAAIQAGLALSDRVDIIATPTTFINGKKIVGAQPLAALQDLAGKELARAQALVEKGVPRGGLYERLIEGGLQVTPPSDVGTAPR